MIGKTLGHYDILESLGAGGMGEVYLGQDQRLGRKVAIKVLPVEYASDPERLARFEQEARAAAALNHPHIAVVHDFGTAPGENGGETHFMVQEYLEGQSLSQRLDKGSLPLERALGLSIEVGEALIAAHKAGIIHRDLKPDNIFVTEEGHAKVLDFGLAKLTEAAAPAGIDATMSPTVLGTVAGQVMGTAGYMAPEQVNGEEIDHRADLFAFGCVLYRVVSGVQAFAGRSVPDSLSRILHADPEPLSRPDATVPDELQRIVGKCLAKDPARRYQGAADLTVDLRALATNLESHGTDAERSALAREPAGPSVGGIPIPWAVLGAVLASGTMSEIEVTLGTMPFFSPEGTHLATSSGVTLRAIPLEAGNHVTLATSEDGISGGSWAADGNVYYGRGSEGIWRVPATGGDTTQVVELDDDEMALGPQLLPGGEWLLFTLRDGSETWSEADIVGYNLASKEVKVLAVGGTDARYLPTGHIVFARDGNLFAAPFDVGTTEAGSARLVVSGIAHVRNGVFGGAQYAISESGTLAYLPPVPASFQQVLWVDPSGGSREPWGEPIDLADSPRISPDGTRALVTTNGAELLVLTNDQRQPLVLPTGGFPVSRDAIWTPDGDEIVYEAVDAHMYRIAADGSGRPRPVGPPEGHRHPFSWTAEGDLVFHELLGDPRASLWSMPLDGDTEPSPILVRDFADGAGGASVSPDERWIAFTSQPDTSIPSGIFIMELPDGEPRRVSSVGGVAPMWSADGTELYFSNGQMIGGSLGGDAMMAVSFTDGDYNRPEPPRQLFRAPELIFSFDVAEDGRFLMVERAREPGTVPHINVIVNWFEELKRLVPTDR